MQRAIEISLQFATQKKKDAIRVFLQSYRHAVNFFIKSLWDTRGKLDAETLKRLPTDKTRLSYKQKNQTLKQAIEMVVATKKSAKELKVRASMPVFTGMAILNTALACIQDGKKSFDLIVRISSLKKNSRIIIPTRKTRVLNEWLSKPLAKLVQGCALSEDRLIIWVKLPDLPLKEEGRTIGIDLGVNKLIATSDGEFFGKEFKDIRDKILRKEKGSEGKKRAYEERDQYINRTIKALSWSSIAVLGIEELKGIKKGKRRNRGKRFRRAMAPWVSRIVTTRLGHKAQENRVLLVPVPPENTSRECPRCGVVSQKNRKGEEFCCVACGYRADADYVGATNILVRTLRFMESVESSMLKNVNT